ncbi:MAG: response regulator transcription factor [Candidatus Aminicenantes bacterium]|jgi:two-component system alkaline phosphatase synthesis response regulator PhoP
MTKILIVEDNEEMVTGLDFNLQAQGYKTCVAYDGNQGVQAAERERPDLIILDIMLPKKDGFTVCRELREKGLDMPILMLSAKGEEADKVLGLEVGADDYLTKPFSRLELMARVKALLRRKQRKDIELDKYCFATVEIDFKNFRATKGQTPINLTMREFDMMRLFIQRRGNVISRSQFLDEIWGYEKYPTTRTVDIHVAKLRQKLEPKPESPQFILTVHGIGYKFIG